MTDDSLDLDERALCPDGACIGVLGDDGRCKVCGAVGDGSVVSLSSRRAPASYHDDGDGNGDLARGADGDGDGDRDGDGELDDRRLCPDGSCIGLIGDDGRCKVCGLAAS